MNLSFKSLLARARVFVLSPTAHVQPADPARPQPGSMWVQQPVVLQTQGTSSLRGKLSLRRFKVIITVKLEDTEATASGDTLQKLFVVVLPHSPSQS